MSTHTPGPWYLHHFEHDPVFQNQSEIRDGNGLFVCRIEDCPSPTVAADWAACGLFDDDEPQRWGRNLATARLIAAAPDLLAALQRLTHPAADDNDLEHALDVIARATGAA